MSAVARGTEIAEQGFRDEPGEPIDVDTEGKFIIERSHMSNLCFRVSSCFCSAQGAETEDKECNRLLETDASDAGCQCTYSVMHPKGTRLEDAAVKMEISGLDASLASNSSIHKVNFISWFLILKFSYLQYIMVLVSI